MEQKKRKITGAVIWDVLNPFVIAIVLLFLISAIFTMVCAQATGIPDYRQALAESGVSPLVVNIVFYGVCIFVFGRAYRKDHMRFGVQTLAVGKGKAFLYIIIAAAVCYGVNLLISFSPLTEIFPAYTESAAASFLNQPLPLLILSNVVLGPSAEELIFRGLTFRRMDIRIGMRFAFVVSSLLFGVYHANMLQFIYAFITGLIFAYCYKKCGSLYVSIIIHMAVNALAIPFYV